MIYSLGNHKLHGDYSSTNLTYSFKKEFYKQKNGQCLGPKCFWSRVFHIPFLAAGKTLSKPKGINYSLILSVCSNLEMFMILVK